MIDSWTTPRCSPLDLAGPLLLFLLQQPPVTTVLLLWMASAGSRLLLPALLPLALSRPLLLGRRTIPVLHNLCADRCNELAAMLDLLDIDVCSVSLRHSGAMDALERLGAGPRRVGASSAVGVRQLRQAADRGAAFASTTFTTRTLAEAARSLRLPLLAGVLSDEEAELAVSCGAAGLKFYPSSLVPPPRLLDALRSLASRHTRLPPVFVAGGVTESMREAYVCAGADGFVLGVDCAQSPDRVLEALRRTDSFGRLPP